MAHKAKEMDDEAYRALYIDIMLQRIRGNPLYYRKLITELFPLDSPLRVGAPTLVLACYCKAHGFCHRYILINDVFPQVIDEIGIVFEYHGEVT